MKLSVEFKIEGHDISVGEEARMWIDIDRNGALADREEVDLFKNDLTWTGTIDSDRKSDGMLFLVKYIASPGTAKWSLVVRSDEPSDREVYNSKGEVKNLQTRLIGVLRA